jgi:signal transduction histidine kinase
VLTLAKLDARLLIIVPERVNVPFLMNQVVHIYEVELRAAAIETQIRIGRSFGDMQLRDVMLDPGRLIQVTYPLLTCFHTDCPYINRYFQRTVFSKC